MYKQFTKLKGFDEKSNFIYLTSNASENRASCYLIDSRFNKNKFNSIRDKFDYVCAYPQGLQDTNYYINKRINFILNPFNFKERYFDYNTLNVIKQKNIIPVIGMNDFSKMRKFEQIGFLKNAQLLIDICNKLKIPILIDTLEDYNKRGDITQEIAIYALFDISPDKAKMHNKIAFGERK